MLKWFCSSTWINLRDRGLYNKSRSGKHKSCPIYLLQVVRKYVYDAFYQGKYFQGLTSHTAVTIAHEIAHTFGVDHDDVMDQRCNKTYFVMSPRLGEDTPSTRAKWSICSKEKLAAFLQSSKASCLVRQHQEQKLNRTNYRHDYQSMRKHIPLPGVIFGPDRQCQMLFDHPDSHVCNDDEGAYTFCQKLW